MLKGISFTWCKTPSNLNLTTTFLEKGSKCISETFALIAFKNIEFKSCITGESEASSKFSKNLSSFSSSSLWEILLSIFAIYSSSFSWKSSSEIRIVLGGSPIKNLISSIAKKGVSFVIYTVFLSIGITLFSFIKSRGRFKVLIFYPPK